MAHPEDVQMLINQIREQAAYININFAELSESGLFRLEEINGYLEELCDAIRNAKRCDAA